MNWQIIVGVLFLIGGIGNLFTDFSTSIIALLIGIALLYWGLIRKGVIKKPVLQRRTLIEETFHVVGVGYYEGNIHKLACSNPDWKLTAAQIVESGKAGKRIFKYYYVNKPVKLQMEPDNPHDKNAISVIIAGELVGYISTEDNIHVKGILEHREIKSLSGFIGGGEYKIVGNGRTISRHTSGIYVNIRLKYV